TSILATDGMNFWTRLSSSRTSAIVHPAAMPKNGANNRLVIRIVMLDDRPYLARTFPRPEPLLALVQVPGNFEFEQDPTQSIDRREAILGGSEGRLRTSSATACVCSASTATEIC